jgi:hypothetical protein
VIGLFSAATTRLPISYNGVTLNSPTDSPTDTYEVNAVAVSPLLDSISDPNPDDDGTEAYGVRKVKLLITIDGTIRATSYGMFFDKCKMLAWAFDPARGSHEALTGQGFSALDFYVPTMDLTTYTTGLVPSRYYARARAYHAPVISQYAGLASFFRLELECVDPRRYLQTESSVSGVGAKAVDNSAADYRSYPTITITMAGAGSASWTMTRTGVGAGWETKAFVIDLSGAVNLDVYVIDMAARSITKNGVAAPQLYVSGEWFEIEPASQTVTYSNTTNYSACVLAWRRAWCI